MVSVDTSLAGGFGHLVTVWLDGSVAVIFFFLRLLLAGIEQLLSKFILLFLSWTLDLKDEASKWGLIFCLPQLVSLCCWLLQQQV